MKEADIKSFVNSVAILRSTVLALALAAFAVSALGQDVEVQYGRPGTTVYGWVLKDKANNTEYFYLPDGRVMVYKVEAELHGEYDKDGKPVWWWQLDNVNGGMWEYYPDGRIEYITQDELIGC
jgi:hypothetical protein